MAFDKFEAQEYTQRSFFCYAISANHRPISSGILFFLNDSTISVCRLLFLKWEFGEKNRNIRLARFFMNFCCLKSEAGVFCLPSLPCLPIYFFPVDFFYAVSMMRSVHNRCARFWLFFVRRQREQIGSRSVSREKVEHQVCLRLPECDESFTFECLYDARNSFEILWPPHWPYENINTRNDSKQCRKW